MVNLCLLACKKHGIDHYRKKNQENGNNVDDELENEENMVFLWHYLLFLKLATVVGCIYWGF